MNETITHPTETISQQAQMNRGEVAVLSPPRLPWHPRIGERFKIDVAGWKTLVEAIFPNAKTPNSVILALSYCATRNLDPFKRPVHIVPMWRKAYKLPNGQWVKGEMVETVWPSIAELRTTAFRTKQYAGKDEIELGPEETVKFTGQAKETMDDDTGEITTPTKEITVRFPAWGRITVHRLLPNGIVGKFVGPKLHWTESYARAGKTELPNDMWAKRPFDQFEKVVEAAALRCAFPEELGNEYSSDEMEGKTIDVAPTMPAEARQTREDVPSQQQLQQPPQEATPPQQQLKQPVQGLPPMQNTHAEAARGRSEPFFAKDTGKDFMPPAQEQPQEEAMPPDQDHQFDHAQWLIDIDAWCKKIVEDPTKEISDIAAYQQEHINPMNGKVPTDTFKKATVIAVRWANKMMEDIEKGIRN